MQEVYRKGFAMKIIILTFLGMVFLLGCASKEFDQKSYDRQNKVAEKSLNNIDK